MTEMFAIEAVGAGISVSAMGEATELERIWAVKRANDRVMTPTEHVLANVKVGETPYNM